MAIGDHTKNVNACYPGSGGGYPGAYGYWYQYPTQHSSTETVVEETIEYDAQGRIKKKVVKTTTTSKPRPWSYPHYPTVTCSGGIVSGAGQTGVIATNQSAK